MKKYLISYALSGIFLLFFLTGCSQAAKPDGSDAADASDTAVSVSVLNAKRGELSKTVRYSGKISPNDTVIVTSKLGGKVLSVNYDVGDRVSKGALLFTLDDTDLINAVSAARAQYDLALANLNRTTGGAVELQLETLKHQAEQARRGVETAQKHLNRQRELFDAGAISQIELETAENNYNTANEQYSLAKTNYELNLTKIQAENKSAAEAQLAQAKVALDTAETQLANTKVYSQIGGTISSRDVSSGGIISPGMPAFTIIDDSSVYIEFFVTDDTVSKIKPGTLVQIEVPAAGISGVSGNITSISPSANPQTQLYTIKASIKNTDGKLKLGMFATVGITVETINNAICIPVDAVRTDGEKNYVFVVKDGAARQVFVETGASNDNEIIIASGISENDAVIVKGQDFVADGTLVSIVGNGGN